MKFSSLKILGLSFLIGGCQQQLAYLAAPRTATVEQAPFQLELQCVPQHYLNKAHAITTDLFEFGNEAHDEKGEKG